MQYVRLCILYGFSFLLNYGGISPQVARYHVTGITPYLPTYPVLEPWDP